MSYLYIFLEVFLRATVRIPIIIPTPSHPNLFHSRLENQFGIDTHITNSQARIAITPSIIDFCQ